MSSRLSLLVFFDSWEFGWNQWKLLALAFNSRLLRQLSKITEKPSLSHLSAIALSAKAQQIQQKSANKIDWSPLIHLISTGSESKPTWKLEIICSKSVYLPTGSSNSKLDRFAFDSNRDGRIQTLNFKEHTEHWIHQIQSKVSKSPLVIHQWREHPIEDY